MKTLTEFTGFLLKNAKDIELKLVNEVKAELKLKNINETKELKDQKDEKIESTNDDKKKEVSLDSSKDNKVKESKDQKDEKIESTNDDKKKEASLDSSKDDKVKESKDQKDENKIKSKKFNSNKKSKTKKPFIEIPVDKFIEALQEKMKITKEKAIHIPNALKAIDRRRFIDLKRVVVFSIDKEDKTDYSKGKYYKSGEFLFLAEYFPPLKNKKKNNFKKFKKSKKFKHKRKKKINK